MLLLHGKCNPKWFPWLGHGKMLKMTIFPKFLYLLTAPPIHIPSYFLKNVNQRFNDLIGNHKKHRFPCILLSLPKAQGDLLFLDITRHHMAPHLTRLTDQTGIDLWTWRDGYSLHSLSLLQGQVWGDPTMRTTQPLQPCWGPVFMP